MGGHASFQAGSLNSKLTDQRLVGLFAKPLVRRMMQITVIGPGAEGHFRPWTGLSQTSSSARPVPVAAGISATSSV